MNEDSMKRDRVLDALQRALEDWARHGNEQPLTRWLDRELDSQGAPFRLPISDWHDCLKSVLRAKPHDGVWPSHWDEPITRLVQTTLWFTRRDGVPVTEFDPSKSKRPTDWTTADYANDSRGPCIDADHTTLDVEDQEQSRRRRTPGVGRIKTGLDVLRPGWPVEDDFLAIDHRDAKSSCRFELFGAGRSWLGPVWKTDADRRGHFGSETADPGFRTRRAVLAEWSYRAGEARITQSALMLRGRSLALLSMLVEYRSPLHSNPGLSVSLPPGIAAAPIENSRGFPPYSRRANGARLRSCRSGSRRFPIPPNVELSSPRTTDSS